MIDASGLDVPVSNATPADRADLRVAGAVVGGLAVFGALLGLIWSAWSGPQQRAYVISPGKLYPFDEVETMAGADGRYLVLVGATGLLAGAVLFWWRRANRGALLAAALGAGGLAGAALTWWVGYLSGGGTYDGHAKTIIKHLPLSLHMRGLLLIEPALALLVYGMSAAFAASDDLGRPDPRRERLLVRRAGYPQYGGGYGDAAGTPQEGDFAPQQGAQPL